MSRHLGIVTAAVSALVVGALAAPASAATTPPQVGLVSFTAAGWSSGKASLTISWAGVSHATKYQVFEGTTYGSVTKLAKTTTSTKVTISGLTPGKNYFFQVRGLNGSTAGKRSARVGHTAIKTQGTASGPTYKLVTYNLCSYVSSCKSHAWSKREPQVIKALTKNPSYGSPDVIGVQEADNLPATALPGYTEVGGEPAKKLFFKTSRFSLAPVAGEAAPTKHDHKIDMGDNKYAVWGELIDHTADDKHVIFVDVHDYPGKSNADATKRKNEITSLLRQVNALNTGNLPVVYLGDFNSTKNRPNDYLASVFHTNHYTDAYDLAMALSYQHRNSYDDWKTTPVTSVKWGDHVDHVWVNPWHTRVLSWANIALRDGSKYALLGSDHNPLGITVQVN